MLKEYHSQQKFYGIWNKFSDGLSGELYTEDGWIMKYRQERYEEIWQFLLSNPNITVFGTFTIKYRKNMILKTLNCFIKLHTKIQT